MLWTPAQQFHPWPFDSEAELEAVIAEVKAALFGESRICLDVKRLIGERGHCPPGKCNGLDGEKVAGI